MIAAFPDTQASFVSDFCSSATSGLQPVSTVRRACRL